MWTPCVSNRLTAGGRKRTRVVDKVWGQGRHSLSVLDRRLYSHIMATVFEFVSHPRPVVMTLLGCESTAKTCILFTMGRGRTRHQACTKASDLLLPHAHSCTPTHAHTCTHTHQHAFQSMQTLKLFYALLTRCTVTKIKPEHGT